MSYSTLLAQAGLNGLVIGAMYMLMAVGFTLVFGIMGVINLAHGSIYMLGAYVAASTASKGAPFVVAVAAGAAAAPASTATTNGAPFDAVDAATYAPTM